MASPLRYILGWFGWGGSALGEKRGEQNAAPTVALVEGTGAISVDGAMQISTVWACVWLLANVIASLPFFVYTNNNGRRDLARDQLLYQVPAYEPAAAGDEAA